MFYISDYDKHLFHCYLLGIRILIKVATDNFLTLLQMVQISSQSPVTTKNAGHETINSTLENIIITFLPGNPTKTKSLLQERPEGCTTKPD